MIVHKSFGFDMEKESVSDITEYVIKTINESNIKNGIVNVFVEGSTAAISTMEYEEGLKHDIYEALERIAPKNAYYKHHEKWHDGNGRSHVRATIIGQSLTIPIINNQLMLGTWQQIVLFNLDIRDRYRKVFITIIGEN